MTDDLPLRRDRDRGARATALMENDLLKEAFAVYERDLMNAWGSSRPEEAPERERIWLAIKVGRLIRLHLEKVAADGRLAARQLDAIIGRKAA